MDFTREPIIETIITPRDGCKLVVRSSKGIGQEEYFVDAVELVSFGHSLFFRSLERPKSFLVPVTDYEILEVREARMVLKNMGLDRSIKIGGGREGLGRTRDTEKTTGAIAPIESEESTPAELEMPKAEQEATELPKEVRIDKKRDRRRHYRKRRGTREEKVEEETKEGEGTSISIPPLEEGGKVDILPPNEQELSETGTTLSSSLLSSLLQPPPTLISETIGRYRENFKSAFFLSEEEQYRPHDKVQELLNEDDDFTPTLQEPTYDENALTGVSEEVKEELREQNSITENGSLDESTNALIEAIDKPANALTETVEEPTNVLIENIQTEDVIQTEPSEKEIETSDSILNSEEEPQEEMDEEKFNESPAFQESVDTEESQSAVDDLEQKQPTLLEELTLISIPEEQGDMEQEEFSYKTCLPLYAEEGLNGIQEKSSEESDAKAPITNQSEDITEEKSSTVE